MPFVSVPCAYFSDESSAGGPSEKGLVIVVPHDNGYFLMLQFRADVRSFDANWDAWWKMVNTLRVFRTRPPLTSEEQQSVKHTDELQKCLMNLMLIDACKEQLKRDNNLPKGTVVTKSLWKRFEEKRSFQCPSGGTYTIGKIGEPSSCSVREHQELHMTSWNMANEE